MSYTQAQEQAITDHARNLIVVAGAGSGKTYVLVERYLALLDRNPDWALNALVAITFTQKAAQEMRDRVRQHVQAQVDYAADDAAAERWSNRLAAMDSARIDTIHGLCASILRANAAEANVDPGFTVLDEVEARVLLNIAIDDVFRSIDSELFAEYGEKEVRRTITEVETFDLEDGDLLAQWEADWLENANAAFEHFLRLCANSDFAGWSEGIPAGDLLGDIWNDCADLLAQISDKPEIELLHALKSSINLQGGKSAAWGDKDILRRAKSALERIRDYAAECIDTIGDPLNHLDQRAAELMPLWIDLAQHVRETYRAAKAEIGALDFDDLETLTCDLLRDESVRARYLGTEFKHVLVDEFQDTNAAQWDIIQRIADPARAGCLFVVGDPKQSIYGFRGADVRMFQQALDQIIAQGGALDLSTSFRTHHTLIECFNALFKDLLKRDQRSIASAYEIELGVPMLANRSTAPSDSPALELLLIDKNLADSREEAAARKWEAREIARRIKRMVEVEQRVVYDKQDRIHRPMRYGDAALLFQALTHVTIYEEALKVEGVPYLTVAGKGYYDRQEVWDLLNLLRALYNPSDNLALASALRSPLFGLSDDALLALRRTSVGARPSFDGTRAAPLQDTLPLSLWGALSYPDRVPPDEQPLLENARQILNDLRRRAGRISIAELLRAALEQTGYLAVLTGLPDGARRRGNVEKLLDKAETSGRITLSAFTQYLDDLRANEAREGESLLESENAVHLMTVHKSKGLEFPLVVLVDSSYRWEKVDDAKVKGKACKVFDHEQSKFVAPFAYRRAERIDKARETAERRRLLYVAATRAQDYLIVSGQVSWRSDELNAQGWLRWLIEALDLHDHPPEETLTVSLEWGAVGIHCPRVPLDSEDAADAFADWDDSPGDLPPPPLVAPVPFAPDAPARSLTATQIADLGSARFANPAESREFYAQRWRRSVLLDAPARIESAQRVSPKKIGEIVHRAIQWHLPDDDGEMQNLLRRYAWEEGIVGRQASAEAVDQAYRLLQRVRRSEVFGWIADAREVHRELPFVYRTDQRTIHGIIDLLLLSPDGQWRLVDYKTSWVEADGSGKPGPALLEDHARRYHLQVGVYAAAVEELVGIAPLVYIHYIRYAQTVVVHERDWKNGLAQLEDTIGDIVDE